MTIYLPRVVGLAGYASVGKDAVAQILHEEYGYKHVGFADKLREFVAAINPIVGWEPPAGYFRYNEVVGLLGYRGAKDSTQFGKEVRRILQVVGTEAGRNILGQNIWVDALLESMDPNKRYVISDVRFPNEVEAVQGGRHHGEVYLITRPGHGPINGHASENSLDGPETHFDNFIDNDGSLEDLRFKVKMLMVKTE